MSALVEICAGSAAISLRSWGADRLVYYKGSKRALAKQILEISGHPGPFDHYIWCEPNRVAQACLLSMGPLRDSAMDFLAQNEGAGKDDWLRWREAWRQDDLGWKDTALALQHWSFSGKGPAAGYGGPGDLSKIDPRWLCRNETISLRKVAKRLLDTRGISFELHTDGASLSPMPAVCYIDPWYVGTTTDAQNLGRDEVVRVALAWREAGATVLVSEGEPVFPLVKAGFSFQELRAPSGHHTTFRAKKREFLTFWRA